MRGQTSPINQQNLVDVCAGVSLLGEVKEPGYLDGGVFCMFHDVFDQDTRVAYPTFVKLQLQA